MTVSSTTTKASYSGNGVTTVFAVPFYFLQNADLLVILRSSAGVETTQVLGTNYSVTGAGNESGGSLTMTVAPPTGTTLTILRNAAATQETDLLPNDRLPAESLETALDKLTMLVQQLDEENDRALKFAQTDSTASTTLPTAPNRANKFLSFDNNGNPIVVGATDTYTVSVEVKTATQGQTVFTLTTMSYIPGINNLSVFVDGVNQVNGTAYTETSPTTVTFSQGLHAGAIVKFSTVRTLTSGESGSDAIQFLQSGTGAQARSVQNKLRDVVSVKDFGATGDGVTDDTAAIQAALNSGAEKIHVPKGTYLFTPPLAVNFSDISLVGEGIGDSVLKPTAVAEPAIHVGRGANVSGFTLEHIYIQGNSTCTAGLELGVAGTYYAVTVDVLKSRLGGFNGVNSSGIKINYGWWINIQQNTTIDYNYYGIYIPTGAVVTTLRITDNTEIQSSTQNGYHAASGAIIDGVVFDGASIEISGNAAIYSTSAATNYVIQNSYFEINGQNVGASGTIYITSSNSAVYQFARAYIDNNQFQVTTNGSDISLGYVAGSIVSNNNGIATITTTVNSQVYFENNQGNGALDALALYKTLLGRINAYERQPSTGYWQHYSSDRFSLSDTHFAIQQTIKPTAVTGVSAGSGATVVIANGSTDNNGRIDFTPGAGASAGDCVTVTFNKTFTTTPLAVVVSYGSSVASGPTIYAVGVNATSFKIGFNGTPISGLQYINYIVIGGQ